VKADSVLLSRKHGFCNSSQRNSLSKSPSRLLVEPGYLSNHALSHSPGTLRDFENTDFLIAITSSVTVYEVRTSRALSQRSSLHSMSAFHTGIHQRYVM
jgi:hypothetical protein